MFEMAGFVSLLMIYNSDDAKLDLCGMLKIAKPVTNCISSSYIMLFQDSFDTMMCHEMRLLFQDMFLILSRLDMCGAWTPQVVRSWVPGSCGFQ